MTTGRVAEDVSLAPPVPVRAITGAGDYRCGRCLFDPAPWSRRAFAAMAEEAMARVNRRAR